MIALRNVNNLWMLGFGYASTILNYGKFITLAKEIYQSIWPISDQNTPSNIHS